jgi:hypothetical protein
MTDLELLQAKADAYDGMVAQRNAFRDAFDCLQGYVKGAWADALLLSDVDVPLDEQGDAHACIEVAQIRFAVVSKLACGWREAWAKLEHVVPAQRRPKL